MHRSCLTFKWQVQVHSVKSPFSQKCVFLHTPSDDTSSLTLKGCFHSLTSVTWKFPFTVSGLHSEVAKSSKRFSLRDFILFKNTFVFVS